jgi:hypothetical protein
MPDSNVLKLDVHMDKFVFWSKLYLMWVRQSSTNIVTTEMRGMMLKSMNDQMAKRIKELEKELLQKEAQLPKGETQYEKEEKSSSEAPLQNEVKLQKESPKKEKIPLLDATTE